MSDDIEKPCLKADPKDIKDPINNQTFLVADTKKGGPVPQCMDLYKAKVQSDGSIDKLNIENSG